jgi:DNA-binding transcriptional regulator YiaG
MRDHHLMARGEQLPQSKLTEADVRNIRELHALKQSEIARLNETLSAKALARKWDVHVRTIDKILTYETWKHVR